MAARLEHEEFAKYLHEKFRIRLNEQTIEAELTEISEHLVSPRQERFSIVFRTSNEMLLEQGQRPFEHDQMGSAHFRTYVYLSGVPTVESESGNWTEGHAGLMC